MGYKLNRVELKLNENEEKDITIVLKPEKRAAIHGVVRFPDGTPVKNALVKLFAKKGCDPCELVPITFAFTDDCGQFLFGVDSNIEFVIKVFYYVREKTQKCDIKKDSDAKDFY